MNRREAAGPHSGRKCRITGAPEGLSRGDGGRERESRGVGLKERRHGRVVRNVKLRRMLIAVWVSNEKNGIWRVKGENGGGEDEGD